MGLRVREEQIACALRIANGGTQVVDVCLQIGWAAASSADTELNG